MKADELGLTVVALAAGVVLGFVAWTYIGPMLHGSTSPTA